MSGQFEGFEPETKKRKQEIKREFKVYINEDEMERIRQWVALRPDIETGGDLFGLWIDQHTAVVQFVLGPGKNCHRTTTSFFQDVSYLENVGSYLTEKHGLCNIGQWHSHHTIPLFQPSVGDNNTVWSNMPTLGIERYIVFIANIKSHDVTKKPSDVSVNCFLFEINDGKQLPVIQGSYNIVSGESPFRLNNDVMDIVRIEAEILTEGKKEKELEEVSELLEESVGRKEETETAPLPQEDQGNPEENSMLMRSTESADDKAVSVSDKNTPDVAAGTSSFNDERTVDNNSKMGGTKNHSKVRKRNTSSNKITISSTDNNKVRSSLVDNNTRTSTKTEIPTANDSNHDNSNNGEDNTKSGENKNSNENKMGESDKKSEGKKNNNTSLNISNTSANVIATDTFITSVTSTTSKTSPNVTSSTNVTPTYTALTPTETQTQTNEQHSDNSLQENPTIDEHKPKPECDNIVTKQPESDKKGDSLDTTLSQQNYPNILCCFSC